MPKKAMKYQWDIALERAALGAVIAALGCVNKVLETGVLPTGAELRHCVALALSGAIGGLLIDLGIYRTAKRG